jgi:hypothetical protein
MNLQNWYNPDNATVTTGYVSAWNDSMSNYNLSNVAVGGTGNTMTKVIASGTTSNVIYQIATGDSNYSVLYGDTFSETIYTVMFCCNTTAVLSGFDTVTTQYGADAASIRYLVGNNSLNNGDLNQNGSTYVNGTLVQTANTVTLPPSVPTGYTIYCFYITGGMRTAVTKLCVLGETARANLRGYKGYMGDLFIGNASFGATEQQLLEGYLGYKYKCQSSLPTNHPYYSSTNSKIVTLN